MNVVKTCRRDRFARRDRGAVIPLVGMALAVLVLMTAFAVDLGRQRDLRRDLQANADVIALDLVRLITEQALSTGTEPTVADLNGVTLAALNESLQRNESAPVTGFTDLQAHGATVEWGEFDRVNCGSAPADPDSCFIPDQLPINAVRVTFNSDIEYFFQAGRGAATRSAVATTGDDPLVGMTLGSFAARLDTGRGVLLPMLSGLLGLDADLDALGYSGLATSTVALGPLLSELGVGSADQVAGTEVYLADFYEASAAALDSDDPDDAASIALMEGLDDLGVPHQTFDLGDLFAVESGAGDAALDTDVNLFDLVMSGAQLANGQNAASVDGLELNLGPAGTAAASVRLVEAPQMIIGGVGASGSTAQAEATVDLDALSGLLSGIAVTGIELEVGAGAGTSEITSICDPDLNTFTAQTHTELLPVTLTVGVRVSVPLLVTTVDIDVDVILETTNGAPTAETSTFSWTEPPPGRPFTPPFDEVGQDDLGLPPLSHRFESDDALLDTALNLGLLDLVLSTVNNTLVPEVDALLSPIVSELGINLVGADLAPFYAACEGRDVSLVE